MVDFNKKILNSNKFRQAALHFQKHGCYLFSPKGTSEYIKYWEEEEKRCLEGYTAEDGDFITGYHYFYLNYCPIQRITEIETKLKSGEIVKRKTKGQDFPDFYDYDYYFFCSVEEAEVEGKHMVVLKARRKGYSFKCSAMMCRNYYMIPNSKSYAYASEAEFLVKDGIITKAWEYMDFIDEHTAWSKKRQKIDTKMHRRSSVVVTDNTGNKIEVGYKSDIIGVTVKNDIQKVRGKAGKLILFEEAGKFPNLLDAWNIARSSVEQDGYVYGTMIAFGTGGTVGANFDSVKELFERPEGYGVKAFSNIWDENAQDTKCGFFVPYYANLNAEFDGKPLMDNDGNSNVSVATQFALAQRQPVIENAKDKNALDRYVAEYPLTPAESMLQISGNIFPKKLLLEQLAFVKTHTKVQNLKQVGDLEWSENGLKWEVKKHGDIVNFPLSKADDPTGAIVIWEHPCDNPPYGLYIAGCLTPGEKVYTDKGLKNVEDVTLEDKLINKEGELVNINTLLRYNKIDEPTYKVYMSNVDRPTNYTQEHPLYVANTINSDFEFIRLRDIKKGMWTKYPNFYSNNKQIPYEIWNNYENKRKTSDINPLGDEDFWWFVGHWLGDGFNNKQGENYTIYNSFGLEETEYVDKYKNIVSRLFNRNPHLKLQNGSNTHKFEYKQLFLFLEDNFGKYADGKYISEWVKYLPNNLKNHLILGYLDSDGSVYKDKTTIRATFKSINRKLLNDIQDVLFSIGIVSSFNLSDLAGTYNIKGKVGNTKESYALRINQTELKKLSDKFKCDYHSRKLRLAKEIIFKQKPKISDSCIISEDNRYIYLKISRIEESLYTGIVYNFDCDTHNFVTQYCTGHNCDPYDHDQSGTSSLGSTFIFKRSQNFENNFETIVAEYTGRPERADIYYENVRKLLTYYNAKMMYENERKGLFVYFHEKHCDYLLADQPSELLRDILDNSKVNRGKGIHMNQEIKLFGEGELKEWLCEEYEPGKPNVKKILSIPLLEELINFNDTGNYDRVMSMITLVLYRRFLINMQVKRKEETVKYNKLFEGPLFELNLGKDITSGNTNDVLKIFRN